MRARLRAKLLQDGDRGHRDRWKQDAPNAADAGGQTLRACWAGLSANAKEQALRFEDTALVHTINDVWQELMFSDMTCYIVGMRDWASAAKAFGLSMFTIEGDVNDNGLLGDAALIVKDGFADRSDLFEFLERQLGSPLLCGRPRLHRREWPSLFAVPLNSWSDFRIALLTLVELAVAEAAEKARAAAGPDLVSSKSRSAKRNARKRRTHAPRQLQADAVGSCPVCLGTQTLLGSACPLCVSDSDEGCEHVCQVCNGSRDLLGEACPLCMSDDATEARGESDPSGAESMQGVSDVEDSAAGAPVAERDSEASRVAKARTVSGAELDCHGGCFAPCLESTGGSELSVRSDEDDGLAQMRLLHTGHIRAPQAIEEGPHASCETHTQFSLAHFEHAALRSMGMQLVIKNTFIDVVATNSSQARRRSRSQP